MTSNPTHHDNAIDVQDGHTCSELSRTQDKSERRFEGKSRRLLDFMFALTSALIIYWTIDIATDAVYQRAIYLMLVFVLCALVYPFSHRISGRLSWTIDIAIIVLSVAGSIYVMYDYNDRFMRLSALNTVDIVFGVFMIIIGLDIGRRVIGWALTLVASAAIVYTLIGNFIPGVFGHPGFDPSTIVSQVFSGLEGYYGMASRFMIRFVVPFILLGAFLEVTGAGDFFMNLAFSLTRRTVGGPAKAAVIGSALMGSISGSAIANVSSTGCFTIPMMKRIGYKPHVAGAIEAAASTGGQIMPPVMGAVAFIMVEFTQIPYLHIVKVACIPIFLYYITVYAFIHFEARKYNISAGTTTEFNRPIRFLLKTGWHYFFALLIIVIIMTTGLSPAIAALGGIVSLVLIHSLLHRRLNFKMLYSALVLGGKYSLAIGSIVACIGIILALVGLTGVGLKFSWFLADLSHGSEFLAIIFVGLISLILGMGLPSGPAYIVLAITAGPALVDLGFPVLVAHFIMIWFSIDSEITPPVGLASITAAGIARADPMKTMLTAFKFSKGLYILPFMFLYRPGVLLQGSWFTIIETIIALMLGLIAFAAFLENRLCRKARWPERGLLLLAAAGLLWPPVWLNAIGCLILAAVALIQTKSIAKKGI